MAEVVADASALVDLLLANDLGGAVGKRLAGTGLHAPAHVDAEVLSAFGRLHRAGELEADMVEMKLNALAAAPITRHAVHGLLLGAWARRHRLRLADALYIELAAQLDCPLVTTDRRLHDEPGTDIVSI
ncbi:MAG: type II toxin-antitoxin system VapC family toxin [Actinomycetota bacterium]|nr:type II toxin-antitoxin system VapC family toxin [Actinomycetota bacterium]